MANSKYEYVRLFEQDATMLPNCWLVVRLDGKGFTKFCEAHHFEKPNDVRALNLMNQCAKATMAEFSDVVMAFGESDEYSFVLRRDTQIYHRRTSKLASLFAAHFSAAFVFYWREHFGDVPLQSIPAFDGRVVAYPTDRNLRDYLAWRQVDTHINNQYNTCFWNLVLRSGKTPDEAHKVLSGTLADFKNELLFRDYGINYNDIDPMFRRGTFLMRDFVPEQVVRKDTQQTVTRMRRQIVALHDDIIGDAFWKAHPELLKS